MGISYTEAVFQKPLNLFRVFSVAEAITWTLLILGMILRATLGWSWSVAAFGGIHGFVFLCYVATSILVAKNQRWTPWPWTAAIGSAIIPFATIPVELWLHRTGRLAGGWRIEQTADPRDATWHDRLLRTVLRRPRTFAAIGAIAVVVVFSGLLLAGPPGSWTAAGS
jgi:integral membrane protein